jgi:hypothetical protein
MANYETSPTVIVVRGATNENTQNRWKEHRLCNHYFWVEEAFTITTVEATITIS